LYLRLRWDPSVLVLSVQFRLSILWAQSILWIRSIQSVRVRLLIQAVR
jgi:hypothetical protein